MTDLRDTSMIKANQEVVSCELAGGAALLDMRSGMYYSLNAVGAHVWSLLQEPVPLSQICDSILQAYDVSPAQCRRDLEAMLRDMAKADLVQVENRA